MSAYLERLAGSARNPSTGVAPLVRPPYLTPRIEPEPAGSALERLEDETAAVSPRTAEDRREPREPRVAPRLASTGRPGPPPPTAAAYDPLLAELAAPVAVAAPPPEKRDPPPSQPVSPDDAKAPPAVEVDVSSQAETPDARQRALPAPGARPDEIQVRGGQQDPWPRTSSPSLAPPRPLRARSPGRPAPDEIQIHIGRVEVVALAPPGPPPTPPQRERRALSLDDYLRTGG